MRTSWPSPACRTSWCRAAPCGRGSRAGTARRRCARRATRPWRSGSRAARPCGAPWRTPSPWPSPSGARPWRRSWWTRRCGGAAVRGGASCGRPRRVDVLPEAVEVVRRVARLELLELRVQREPLAHEHAPVLDLGLEAVERADRRAAGDGAVELVDAAVARADEALRRLHVADRAAEVHAPRGDRHVGVLEELPGGVAARVALADVDGGLAGLARVGVDRGHHRCVGERVEVLLGADVLPV